MAASFITLNGAPRELPAPSTVAELVASLDLAADRVAVELNGCVVPRRTWSEVALHSGDRVELVTFVGGG